MTNFGRGLVSIFNNNDFFVINEILSERSVGTDKAGLAFIDQPWDGCI